MLLKRAKLIGATLLAASALLFSANAARVIPDGFSDHWTADNGVVPVIQVLNGFYRPDGSYEVDVCITGVGSWSLNCFDFNAGCWVSVGSGRCVPVNNPVVTAIIIPAGRPVYNWFLSVYNVRGWPAWDVFP